MARRRSSSLARRIKLKREIPSGSFWEDLNRRIKEGKVIPIISNSVRNDRIFDIDHDGGTEVASDEVEVTDTYIPTVDEELAQIWADSIGYPMPDKDRLARVALYNRVKSDDADQAKTKYLTFLRSCLLKFAAAVEDAAEVVEELEGQLAGLSFSDIACELDYPKFKEGQEDPLRLLARLPLPIFVTTSYYSFLERALQAEKKAPRTQVCVWYGKWRSVSPEHCCDPNFIPTVEEPAVYHLYGFEAYPESLVLSEDDYLDFLIKVTRVTGQREPIIPLYLREALTESSLLLLGYRLQDLDFRVLFRWIINTTHDSLRKFSLAIHLRPGELGGIDDEEEARRYLQDYFGNSNFKVEWGDTDRFIARLWQEWDEWRHKV